MKKVLLAVAVLILFAVGSVHAASCTAGSLTKTILKSTRGMLVEQLDITSDASGDVNGSTNCELDIESRYIYKVSVKPDSGGTAPTALYDCRFNDPLGNDVMQGELQNLPQTNTVTTGIYSPLIGGAGMASYGYEKLDLVCENMGNAKGTTFNVYYYKE